ncbi:MAG: Hsp20 family protein [Pseudomonadales bacterium]|nr:Hsp20 family protein [Pseudomonadales bacterium]
MNTIDLTPLYRSSIGFDRIGAMLDKALLSDHTTPTNPPYDIEIHDDNQYAIRLAVAGFDLSELVIQVEKSVLTVTGKKAEDKTERQYIYQGISNRAFECQFNLADHVEVTGAELHNGLLTIHLVKEIPEEMKPKSIAIHASDPAIDRKSTRTKVA